MRDSYEERLRVYITLKSGKSFSIKLKDEPAKLSKVLSLIDDVWKGIDNKDGYIQFGHNFFRASEIVHYKFVKLAWWRF